VSNDKRNCGELFPTGRAYGLLCGLRLRGIQVVAMGGDLIVAPSRLLTDEDRGDLVKYGREVLALLPAMLTPGECRRLEAHYAQLAHQWDAEAQTLTQEHQRRERILRKFLGHPERSN
jgi:hypothetical protein